MEKGGQVSPAIMAVIVVLAVALAGGLGWFFFLRPAPTMPSNPPPFIDPATGRPRGMEGGQGSGSVPSPIGQRPGGGMPGGYPGTGAPSGGQ
jgi:hypothetical protein